MFICLNTFDNPLKSHCDIATHVTRNCNWFMIIIQLYTKSGSPFLSFKVMMALMMPCVPAHHQLARTNSNQCSKSFIRASYSLYRARGKCDIADPFIGIKMSHKYCFFSGRLYILRASYGGGWGGKIPGARGSKGARA